MHSIGQRSALLLLVAVGLGTTMPGCLTRPVSKNAPTTKTSFTTAIRQAAIDKVDLLFAIDNSASMGDKQEYLKLAVPDLVSRLLNPYCVNDQGVPIVEGGRAVTTSDGNCARGKAEFQPVQDMHIGIVTSSLGPRTGDVCDPNDKTPTGLDSHQDDRGHLINRAGDNEAPIPSMNPSNFLAWFPSVTKNQNKKPPTGAQAIVQADALANSFRDLVSGVHQLGCGVESQLESWYRFLVQPDPYDTIGVSNNRAEWIGVDTTILKQRKDFLRPDSLVSVIVLTDENDSEIDVRSVGGNGYKFMSKQFKPPRGTSACDSDPNSSACTSCDLAGAAVKQNDSSCQKGPYAADNDWGYDMNLRHVHAKQKYGIDPQFPIERYLTGLTQRKVPDRQGEYPDPNAAYKGEANCTNPLYAASLPDGSDVNEDTLCKLQPGPRTPDLVFYGIIGGVPYQLLHFDPNVPGSAQLNDADWVKVLGQNPLKYDYTGIDPHMVESFKPRPGLAPATGPNNADPIHGREWVTDTAGAQSRGNIYTVDRQYACIFPLAQPRDCTTADNQRICDCPNKAGTPSDQIPPVCDPQNPTRQTHAKTYPTIRELTLAKLMGAQGIVASLCPIHVTEQGANDPLFGYRPAVATLLDRLKNALANQCLPRPLVPDSEGNVPCLILETLPEGDQASACDPSLGLKQPNKEVLARFKEQQAAESTDGATSNLPVCEVTQLKDGDLVNGSCTDSTAAGWCYVEGAAAGTCGQAIKFSATGNPRAGARISLQCIQLNGTGAGSSGTGDTADGG